MASGLLKWLIASPIEDIAAGLFINKKAKKMNEKIIYDNLFKKNLNEISINLLIKSFSLETIEQYYPIERDNLKNFSFFNSLYYNIEENNINYYQLFFNNNPLHFLNYYKIDYFEFITDNSIFTDNTNIRFYKYYSKNDLIINYITPILTIEQDYGTQLVNYKYSFFEKILSKKIFNIPNNYITYSFIKDIDAIILPYYTSISYKNKIYFSLVYSKNIDINLINSFALNKTLSKIRMFYNNDNDIKNPIIIAKQDRNTVKYTPINTLAYKKPSTVQNIIEIPLNLKIDENTGLLFNTGNIEIELIFKY